MVEQRKSGKAAGDQRDTEEHDPGVNVTWRTENVCLLPQLQHSNDRCSKANERSLEPGNIGFPHVQMRAGTAAPDKCSECKLLCIAFSAPRRTNPRQRSPRFSRDYMKTCVLCQPGRPSIAKISVVVAERQLPPGTELMPELRRPPRMIEVEVRTARGFSGSQGTA